MNFAKKTETKINDLNNTFHQQQGYFQKTCDKAGQIHLYFKNSRNNVTLCFIYTPKIRFKPLVIVCQLSI